MTCIIQDPDGAYSIWLDRTDENGVCWYTVQVGRTEFHDVPGLAMALELCGLTYADVGVG